MSSSSLSLSVVQNIEDMPYQAHHDLSTYFKYQSVMIYLFDYIKIMLGCDHLLIIQRFDQLLILLNTCHRLIQQAKLQSKNFGIANLNEDLGCTFCMKKMMHIVLQHQSLNGTIAALRSIIQTREKMSGYFETYAKYKLMVGTVKKDQSFFYPNSSHYND